MASRSGIVFCLHLLFESRLSDVHKLLYLLTAFWQRVCPRPTLKTRPPALPEEDEAVLTLKRHLLPGVEELLRAQRAAVIGAAGKPAILAWKKD